MNIATGLYIIDHLFFALSITINTYFQKICVLLRRRYCTAGAVEEWLIPGKHIATTVSLRQTTAGADRSLRRVSSALLLQLIHEDIYHKLYLAPGSLGQFTLLGLESRLRIQ